jgi:hypothetical protein
MERERTEHPTPRASLARLAGFSVGLNKILVKFIEIIAAGLATAVSGYLIVHLSGRFILSCTDPCCRSQSGASEHQHAVQPTAAADPACFLRHQ